MLLKLVVVGVFVWHKQIEEKMRGHSLTCHVYVRVSNVKVHIFIFDEKILSLMFLRSFEWYFKQYLGRL